MDALVRRLFILFCAAVCALAVLSQVARAQDSDEVITNFAEADANIGERLFLETRFSQYFYTNSGGNANADIPGDPTVAMLLTTSNLVTGPFAGQAMNCRQCHIVDEKGYGPYGDMTLGNRTYADFAQRSPIPPRDDGRTQTPRNAQPLVDALIPRPGPTFLHYDGQFATVHDLIIGTMTGRNYGWEPQEYQTAIHHIAQIIRNDDGMGYLATEERGGRFDTLPDGMALSGEVSYANIFSGFMHNGSYMYDPRTLTPMLISPQYVVNIDSPQTTDVQIVDTAASLIEAYLLNLFFSQGTNGLNFVGAGTPIFNGSPFDTFLIKNGLPQVPAQNETAIQYSQRLLTLVETQTNLQFVTDPDDGSFTTLAQSFTFGTNELEGLKIFLRNTNALAANHSVNVGNCATCHTPPAFTDFIFHNTGATQEEYDAINGAGAFANLPVPDLATRNSNYNAYLPPTPQHPTALGIFEMPPSTNQPAAVDLGLWNVYANPDFPAPQTNFAAIAYKFLGLSVPQLVNEQAGATNFTFTGTNGTPGAAFSILSATTLGSPFNWSVVTTGVFDTNGAFQASFPILTNAPQQFYKVELQVPGRDVVLPHTIALFKTSNLRDLAMSDPYLHTGRMGSLEQVIQFYQTFSEMARTNQVRNGDIELQNISLNTNAVAPLAAFLRALNEDYTD